MARIVLLSLLLVVQCKFEQVLGAKKKKSWCNEWKRIASDRDNDDEEKFRETERAFSSSNMSTLNELQHPKGLLRQQHEELAVINYKTPSHAEDSWFGSIFGVSLMVQRLNGKKLKPLINWLKEKILRWRKHSAHPEWTDDETAVQPRAKFHKHNVLAEALASKKKAVQEAALYLQFELRKRLLMLMTMHEKLPGLKAQECPGNNLKKVWQNRTKRVPYQVLLATPPGISQQSYVLAHRHGIPRHDHLKFHHHTCAWHATLTLCAEGANTTYHAPPPLPGLPRPLFNLVFSDYMLVLSSGGYEHAVPPPPPTYRSPKNPRLSIAFDFIFDLPDPRKGAIRHPSARFPSEPFKGGKDPLHVDPHSFFAPFIAPADLKKNLEKVKSEGPLSFDWTSLVPNGPEPPPTKKHHASFWAGLIDLRHLLPPPDYYAKWSGTGKNKPSSQMDNDDPDL